MIDKPVFKHVGTAYGSQESPKSKQGRKDKKEKLNKEDIPKLYWSSCIPATDLHMSSLVEHYHEKGDYKAKAINEFNILNDKLVSSLIHKANRLAIDDSAISIVEKNIQDQVKVVTVTITEVNKLNSTLMKNYLCSLIKESNIFRSEYFNSIVEIRKIEDSTNKSMEIILSLNLNEL